MIHIAIKAASLSVFRQRVGAAVIKNGNVLSTACNAIRYHKGKFLKKWENSLHSEQAALLMLPLEKRKGSSLYVARLLKDGSLNNAKPCKVCQDLIIKSGVKEVFYTNEFGEVVRWRVKPNGRDVY